MVSKYAKIIAGFYFGLLLVIILPVMISKQMDFGFIILILVMLSVVGIVIMFLIDARTEFYQSL